MPGVSPRGLRAVLPKTLAALALSVALALAWAPAASANGGGGVVAERELEHYRVTVRGMPVQPSVGQWHVSVFVVSRATGEPVQNATVGVQFAPPEATPAPGGTPLSPRSYTGVPCGLGEGCYDVSPELGGPGQWAVVVSVDGPEGDDSFEFVVRVREGGLDVGLLTMNGILVVVVALIVWTTRMWWGRWLRRWSRRDTNQRSRGKQG